MPSPEGVNFNDRVLLVASTQSGKSTFARYLFEHFDGVRRTLIDVKGSHELGIPKASTPGALDLSAPVSHYVPAQCDRDEYEALFDAVWEARSLGPRITWVDEAMGPTGKGYAPRGLRLGMQQGAELGQGFIVCTQRPVGIETTLRTEAAHVFVWDLTTIDLRVLAPDLNLEPEALARELAEHQEAQGQYAFLWYRRAGKQLTRCAPLDPSWVGRGPLSAPRLRGAGAEQAPA